MGNEFDDLNIGNIEVDPFTKMIEDLEIEKANKYRFAKDVSDEAAIGIAELLDDGWSISFACKKFKINLLKKDLRKKLYANKYFVKSHEAYLKRLKTRGNSIVSQGVKNG